jgi:hypothetical protein
MMLVARQLGFLSGGVADTIPGAAWLAVCFASEAVRQLVNVNPTSEHELYLKLFITNGGGW